MNRFQNILFVSNGIKDETAALQQALLLANESEASLQILIICPQFPPSLEQYKESYAQFLQENMCKSIEKAKAAIAPQNKKYSIDVAIEWENTLSIRIIQRVIRHSHDLLIKAIDKNNPGLQALDMALLRKCPCPVFLHRPLKNNKHIRIAAAIDTEHEGGSGQDLAINLLKLSQRLAAYYHGELSVISCWDLLLEDFMRHKLPKPEIEELLNQESNGHFLALKKLLEKAGFTNEARLYHLKGDPTEMIPLTVHEKNIDILVIGTVARTGIPGFVIGNTAENILQQLDCSLWSIKPLGFVSPVKAY